jgi:SRSO17 transposase
VTHWSSRLLARRLGIGVQRQYTGTAGRIENAQVGVYLVCAATAGHAFIDRALYLPKSWTTNPERCRAAGVPDDIAFAHVVPRSHGR